MKDSKIKSFVESIINIIIWFLISFIANTIVLPLFWYNVSTKDSFYIAIVFTVISLVRSYLIRRIFVNWFYELIFKKNVLKR